MSRTVHISRRVVVLCAVVAPAALILVNLPGRPAWDEWRWSRTIVWSPAVSGPAVEQGDPSSIEGVALFSEGGQTSPSFALRGDRPARLEWSLSEASESAGGAALGVTVDNVRHTNPPYLHRTSGNVDTTGVASSLDLQTAPRNGGWDIVRDFGSFWDRSSGRPESGRYQTRAQVVSSLPEAPAVTFTVWERRGYLLGVAAEWWVLVAVVLLALAIMLRSRRRERRSRPLLA